MKQNLAVIHTLIRGKLPHYSLTSNLPAIILIDHKLNAFHEVEIVGYHYSDKMTIIQLKAFLRITISLSVKPIV